MINSPKFKTSPVAQSRLKAFDLNRIEFGKIISDHMLVSDYKNEVWAPPEIVPYGPLSISPVASSLHYGQTVFEGLKAFRMSTGKISVFRMQKHYDRLSKSLERMCMPQIPFEYFCEGIRQLVETDACWVPEHAGNSLYIRPFVFASNEERFGAHISEEYRFVIFTGPVGALYQKPIRVKVEDHFMRASKGGTGFAKCGGNYGAAFYPARKARKEGFDQVLWTDGSDALHIEESGTMNVMFVIDGIVVTPPLSDTILDGVTRDSFLTLARELGYKTEERKIGVAELITAFGKGKLQEAFGAGTAAIAAPIHSITIRGEEYIVPAMDQQSLMNRLKEKLLAIRTGVQPDVHQWNTLV
jgi:branched-chain amino acid aminotransferase